jgi:RNA polymerase sigma-70 factor (ECF subfamily)
MLMLTYGAKESPVGVTTDASDVYLVAAAKDGDHQAYAELCRRHSKQILQTVLRITRNIADAEDTLQEAFLKGYIHIGRFEQRSAFSSWLTRIAINSALMLLRKKRSQPVYSFEKGPGANDFKLPEPMEPSRNPEEFCIQNAVENDLARAIRCLSPRLRVVMQIRYRDDASVAEIAKILSISQSAVKSRLLRAKLQIRRQLDKNQCLRSGIDSKTLTVFQLLSAASKQAPLERRRSSGMGTAAPLSGDVDTGSIADVPRYQVPPQDVLLPREKSAFRNVDMERKIQTKVVITHISPGERRS